MTLLFNMATYSLPRAVIQLLKTMETYRECLKWNVQEGSHKITLTLVWNFKTKGPPSQTGKEWLWNKIQVVQNKLRLTKSEDGLPSDVCRFLESAGPVTPPRRPPLRRQFSLGKVTWHANQWNSMPTYTRYPSTRQASLSPPSSRAAFHGNLSTRFSWPGASSPVAIRGGSLDETQPTTPKTVAPLRRSKTCEQPPSAPHSITPIRRSDAVDYSDGVPSFPSFDSLDSPVCADLSQSSGTSAQRNNHIKKVYRTESESNRSLENLDEGGRPDYMNKLGTTLLGWNTSMREAMEDPIVNDFRENGVLENSIGDSDSLNIPETTQTVQKCLSTCDNILYKNSTLIT